MPINNQGRISVIDSSLTQDFDALMPLGVTPNDEDCWPNGFRTGRPSSDESAAAHEAPNDENASQSRPSTSCPLCVTDANTGSKRRILVADDEPNIRRFIRDSLGGCYEILEASDGNGVFQILEQSPIDLVITDVCMPEKDGLETIQEIRRLKCGLKILAISGAFDGLFLNAARVFGADATLEKPFAPSQLVSCVHNLLPN